MKIFVLISVIIFHLCSNFAIVSSDYVEPTDPAVCGLQFALNTAWNLDEATGQHKILNQTLHDRPSYSFDANEHKCKKYYRAALGSNNNSFHSKKSCLKLCGPWNLNRQIEESEYEYPEVDDGADPTDPEACGLHTALDGYWSINEYTQKPDKIWGAGWLPRMSFDANKNDCRRFNYGGYGNNKNAFGSRKACLKLCRPWNIKRIKSEIDADVQSA